MAVASESKFSKSSAQMASGSMVVVLLAVSLVILAVLANSEVDVVYAWKSYSSADLGSVAGDNSFDNSS